MPHNRRAGILMKRSALVCLLAGLIASGAAIVGCEDEDDNSGTGPVSYSIVGLWETDYPDTSSIDLWYNEFRADNTFHYGTETNAMIPVGTWARTGDTVTMYVTIPDTATLRSIVAFAAGGNEMTLTAVGGQPVPYVRVTQ